MLLRTHRQAGSWVVYILSYEVPVETVHALGAAGLPAQSQVDVLTKQIFGGNLSSPFLKWQQQAGQGENSLAQLTGCGKGNSLLQLGKLQNTFNPVGGQP